eukprot:SM000060S19650  [mRNA]  locus=s60:369733:372113:+ [translate_table: standard]
MAAAPPPPPLAGLAAATSAADDAAAAVVPARPAATAASAGRAVAHGTGGRRQACLAAAWTSGAAAAAALALGGEAALGPRPAHALGFSGLKDLLTEQKKRTADFLYRPIERSRDKLDQVCTFKLILKNAASLLDNADARKLDGEAALADLVRKFTALKGELLDSVSNRTGERSDLTAAVKDTVTALDNFQASIKEVLGTA